MKAFVKTNNNTFPNVNFFTAWEGFVHMGYSVEKINDIEQANITKDTPFFSGVTIFDNIMKKIGINYERLSTYPTEIKSYLKRNISYITLREAKDIFNKDERPLFVKPVNAKQFHGNLWKSILDLIPLANISDDEKVIVSEPVNFLSEFRCYIQEGDIIAVKHYTGLWELPPNKDFIKETIKAFKSAPIAYALDFGVTDKNETILIEANDGTCLGNYGLDSIHYGEMLIARWFEIVNKK